jgi:hypothetical protein
MSIIHWYELGSAALLVAFIVFAFKQGMKVRPLDLDEQPPVNRYIIPGQQLVGNPPRITPKISLQKARRLFRAALRNPPPRLWRRTPRSRAAPRNGAAE